MLSSADAVLHGLCATLSSQARRVARPGEYTLGASRAGRRGGVPCVRGSPCDRSGDHAAMPCSLQRTLRCLPSVHALRAERTLVGHSAAFGTQVIHAGVSAINTEANL